MAKSRKSEHFCVNCGHLYISAAKPLGRWATWSEDSSFKCREVTHACLKCGFVHSETQVSPKTKAK